MHQRRRRTQRHPRRGRAQPGGHGLRLAQRGGGPVHFPVSGDQRRRRGHSRSLLLSEERAVKPCRARCHALAPANPTPLYRRASPPSPSGERTRMLANIRQFAKSWPARILLIVLAISFVGWGVNQGGTSMISGDQVVKAGSRTVNSLEFRRAYDDYKKRVEQESGQQVTQELAEQN